MRADALNQKDVRKQPGLSERQYDLFENLALYVQTVLRHYDIPAKRATRLGHGTKSAVVAVPKARQPWVIKISAHDDLESEQFFLENAYFHHIPVPRILMSDFTREIIPFDFLFLSFVPGKPPHVFSTTTRFRAGVMFGKYLRKIHAVRVDGIGSIHNHIFTHQPHAWQRLLRTSLQRKFTALKSPSAALKNFLPRVIKLLEHPVLSKFTPQLLHGDAGGNNYLIHCDARHRVHNITFIDPGTWVGGDPMQDLAFTQISWNYPGFSEGVLKGYSSVHTLTHEEEIRFRILQLFNQYWACLVSFSRGRARWKSMLREFHVLWQRNISSTL